VNSAIPEGRLDLTIVLQWQDNPDAEQFRQGVRTYFSAPVNMVDTNTGALLFVNNGNHTQRTVGQFGGSRLCVKFQQAFRVPWNMPPATYVRSDCGAYDHQAHVFRENGPCIYRATFKPIYLVTTLPGEADTYPFTTAECAFIAPQTPLNFRPLQPIPHWLSIQWIADATIWATAAVPANLTMEERDNYIGFLVSSHRNMQTVWETAMAARQIEAREIMQSYMGLYEGQGYPSAQGEPTLWNEHCRRAAGRLMRVMTLLKLGFAPDKLMTFPSPLGLRHLSIGQDMGISFVWGDGERTPVAMLNTFHSRLARSIAQFITGTVLVVLIGNQGNITMEDFNSWKQQNITKADDPHNALIPAQGDVVNATPNIRYLVADTLMQIIERHSNGDTLTVEARHMLAQVAP